MAWSPLERVRDKLGQIGVTLLDEDRRKDLIFVLFNLILGFVSLFMTVVNIFTAKWLLMGSTLLFFVACVLNILLARLGKGLARAAHLLFLVEAVALCCFFCISGTPEGFSALWTCFIPSFAMILLGLRGGTFFSGVGLLMIVLCFWTPAGRGILQYEYTASFMLRFPMIYIAFYLMAFFLEVLRSNTHRELVMSEQRYHYLYRHDALTGLYNRYGFNECMDRVFSDPDCGPLAFLYLDLDKFKNVNDTYGHDAGDQVLRFAAQTIRKHAGEEAAISRWGGEEFTVLLWGETDPAELAEEIRRDFEESRIPLEKGEPIGVTVSIGVSTAAHRELVTIAQLVKTADKCLYQAKDAGRNRVVSGRAEDGG